MIKIFKLLLATALVYFSLWLTPIVHAADEFSSSYEVLYSLSEDGKTDVKQDIKLKNLTDKFFPSSFSLTLPGKGISELEAADSQGPLEVVISEEGDNTKLTVKFTNQQIIGLNKEYGFNLKFRSDRIARRLGKVVSVNIPKVSQNSQIDSFNITLSVPSSFGDPDFITPKPSSLSESGGRINYAFKSKADIRTGISAIFGQSLVFGFEAKYLLKNNSIFPKILDIPLPVDSQYQQTYIDNIEPRPENTRTDQLGNVLASFKVNPGESTQVQVRGEIQTYLKSREKKILSNPEIQSYLTGSKYWDIENPAIKNKLAEILLPQNLQNNLQKAAEIDKYVSNFLQFDYGRLSGNDFKRFGSVTALNNPEKSLSAEFVDLELALLRAGQIPARQVIGFSLAEAGKPYAFYNNGLHSWVEIYDQGAGWVISDPVWESTTKGGQFFNFNDLTHLSLAIGNGMDDFVLPEAVNTVFLDKDIVERKEARLDIKVDSKILSGFPSKLKIRIDNVGNAAFPASELKIDTAKILLESPGQSPEITKLIKTPVIPPSGNLEYELNLKTGAIWHSYQDVLQITFAGARETRVISVEPILSYKIFAVEIIGGVIIIALFYSLILLVHHKSTRKSS
ncbi:MAG TPA: transglutaminase-like domain-containing protein [Patescibacteria group bacterium]|nr:transglutaminase-like domain-containing protein [Patescibacteria group bacterium]